MKDSTLTLWAGTLLSLVYVSSASALDSWPYSDDSERVGVRLFLIEDQEEFKREWAKTEPPVLPIVSSAPLGVELALAVLYWIDQPVLDECRLFMDFSMHDELGKEIAQANDIPVCVGHAPPPRQELGVGDIMVNIVPSGDPGVVEIRARFRDEVSGSRLAVSMPLEITE